MKDKGALGIDKKLLLDAIKLPIYSVSIVPVLVGGAVAYYEYLQLSYLKLLGLTLAGCLVIAWLNLSNDVFDSKTGVDSQSFKPESVVNLVGNPWTVLAIAKTLLACGVGLLLYIISSGPSLLPAYLLACSIGMGYVYQGPPFRLSYKGLGEPLCFFAFGPFATTAFYLTLLPEFAQIGRQVSGTVLGMGVLVGLTTTAILLCSHFHQIEGDKKAGKMSPLVRMGPKSAYQVLSFGVKFTYGFGGLMCLMGYLPPLVLGVIVVGSFGTAQELLRFGAENHEDHVTIKPFKMYATKWHISFHFWACVGFLLAKLVPI